MPHFPHLFKELRIKNKIIKNRIVSSAHGESLANEGIINEKFIRYYARKAAGGAGLIFTCGSGTVYEKAAHPKYVSLWNPKNEEPFKKLTKIVHDHGATIIAQATHKGRRISSKMTGYPIQAPSAVPEDLNGEIPAVLNKEEIQKIIQAYASAAKRLERCGFDGIEVTSYGGHLIEQFWSPVINQRTDEYGGDLAGRMLFSIQVIEAISSAVSEDFIISFRMTGDTQTDAIGLSQEDLLEIAIKLDELKKIDLFNISGSTGSSLELQAGTIPPDPYPRGCYNHLARKMKKFLSVPVMVAGRILDPEQAERALIDGDCDLVAMTRAIIADPDLPNHSYYGRISQIRPCIGTNQGCIGRTYDGFPIACAVNPGIADDSLNDITPAVEKQKVVIVGGGPSGMEAARVSALRGHTVILLERSATLGGQINDGKKQPNRDHYGLHVEWLKREIMRLQVEIQLNTEATADYILELSPDSIVLALGAETIIPIEKNLVQTSCVTDTDVLRGKITNITGKKVLIYDAGAKRGAYAAIFIAEAGAAKVELLSPRQTVCEELDSTNQPIMYRSLAKNKVICRPNQLLHGERDGAIVFKDAWRDEEQLAGDYDYIVFAGFRKSNNQLKEQIKKLNPRAEVSTIGDSIAPRTMSEAIAEGVRIGNKIGSELAVKSKHKEISS
ncbi:FAD-dependent oxidoreductase [Siminovitchia sp. 179-K 8D1 HS]|uniref:oxidoreductase n=1 Tax=Siminovitchia sp. 179-K 8D1 HS TaxID=3142385 RepID=UPI0039A390F4